MPAFRGELLAPVWFALFFAGADRACSRSNSNEEKCESLLPDSYDRGLIPQIAGQPAKVFIQMEVLDLDEINEENMEFRLHFFIRSIWKDSRISANSSEVSEACGRDIWSPDLMFEDAKEMDDIGRHTKRFTLRNGYLYLSQRMSFKVACMMSFHLYPFDRQSCVFSIRFMSNDDCAALLRWSDDEESPYKHKMPGILRTKELDPLQFIIEEPVTTYRVKHNKFSLTNFTYLVAIFPLSRRLTGSVINYYMPSTLLVIISWVTFWLREDASAERVTLIMTGLLTICTQVDQYKSELPPVNYIVAMDVWYFACMFMLFAALLQFAFNYNAYRDRAAAAASFPSFERQNGVFSASEDSKDAKTVATTKLDSVCKVVFPGFFLTFTAFYWWYYCSV